jgi:hypothetical protein
MGAVMEVIPSPSLGSATNYWKVHIVLAIDIESMDGYRAI